MDDIENIIYQYAPINGASNTLIKIKIEEYEKFLIEPTFLSYTYENGIQGPLTIPTFREWII